MSSPNPLRFSSGMSADDPVAVDFQRIVLDQFFVQAGLMFSRTMLDELRNDHMRMEHTARAMGDRMAFNMKAFLWGREAWTEKGSPETKTEEEEKVTEWLKSPVTWFDHLKETFQDWCDMRGWHRLAAFSQPRFKLFPVKTVKQTNKTTTNVTKHFHVCPHLNSDPHAKHLVFLSNEPERATSW